MRTNFVSWIKNKKLERAHNQHKHTTHHTILSLDFRMLFEVRILFSHFIPPTLINLVLDFNPFTHKHTQEATTTNTIFNFVFLLKNQIKRNSEKKQTERFKKCDNNRGNGGSN